MSEVGKQCFTICDCGSFEDVDFSKLKKYRDFIKAGFEDVGGNLFKKSKNGCCSKAYIPPLYFANPDFYE